MRFDQTFIAGVVRVELDVRGDARGRFKRHFCAREFAQAGLATGFVQMNHSITVGRGTARGMHFQKGCAHGFQVLSEEAQLVYLHTDYYQPEMEGGVRLDDPAIGIDWPLPIANRSPRDLGFPPITDDFRGLAL